MIQNWSWANGEAILRSGNSLLGLSLRDLVDATYRLFTLWCCLSQPEREQLERVEKHFRDAEVEWETGVPVLPGWAALGNVASQYGLDDDPFAVLPDEPTS